MGGKSVQDLKDIANKLRINSIKATNASNSGHPTSCCSMAEIMSVLFFNTMKFKVSDPRDPSSDRFVLSKGHAAPILYAAWAEAGLFPESDLLKLRKIDCDLEGHPTPRLSFVDVATGSLGQGLSCSAGIAYTGKYFENASYRVYCLIGDGESAEGSIWEALSFAGHYKLDNLVAIFDINRLGQSEPTMFQHHMDVYEQRLKAFGFNTIVIDGHDVEQIINALENAANCKGKPTAILAKTYKGKGLAGIEDEENWHGKPLGAKAENAIKELLALIANNCPPPIATIQPASDVPPVDNSPICLSEPPNYTLGETVATRLAYGTALLKLGTNSKRIVALDADTKNSTYSDKFRKAFPDRFVECFIAEQNLIGVAVGCSTRGRKIPFTSTFATFYTEHLISCAWQLFLRLISSAVDLTVEFLLVRMALLRWAWCVKLAANIHGICFIRTSRPNTPVIYANDEPFAIGKAKVVKKSASDVAVVISAGVTLFEALKAADLLDQQGINVRVIDLFTVKPIDVATIQSNAKECGGRIITVEDHYGEGGIGEPVSGSVVVRTPF
ncbi:Transketolase like protein [Argiope bruennichi]|uniref:Transketolase n=1 Tax=Argiope bruennichi TaxID=94029 RepID=A0A8T0EW76_ARGBR|nr:Transketolase like protein [Argiope bruennichi]